MPRSSGLAQVVGSTVACRSLCGFEESVGWVLNQHPLAFQVGLPPPKTKHSSISFKTDAAKLRSWIFHRGFGFFRTSLTLVSGEEKTLPAMCV